MTPAEFAALKSRHELAIQQMFAPSAILGAIYVNAHLKEGARRVTPEDFIPGAKEPMSEIDSHSEVIPMTPDQVRAALGWKPRNK